MKLYSHLPGLIWANRENHNVISQIKLIYFSSHFQATDAVGQEYRRRKGNAEEMEYVECQTEESQNLSAQTFHIEPPQKSLLMAPLWTWRFPTVVNKLMSRVRTCGQL